MKQIVAVVRPFVAEAIVHRLHALPTVEAVQVLEAKGFGRQKTYLDRYSQSEFSLAFLPKVEISVFVDNDDDVETVIETISQCARSGRRGDGKIHVLPLNEFVDVTVEDPKP